MLFHARSTRQVFENWGLLPAPKENVQPAALAALVAWKPNPDWITICVTRVSTEFRMPGKFEHACFISYKHPPKNARGMHFYREFVEALQERLEFYLATDLRVYVDKDADPGTSYPKELSEKLCKSVCLIAILVPEYPDSKWCQAEWKAMVKLENKRLEGKVGLIIPIALRRSAEEWNALIKRKPYDFSRISVPALQLRSVKNSEKIQEIAETITSWVKQVQDPCDDCTQFVLAVKEDALSVTPTFADPDPFV